MITKEEFDKAIETAFSYMKQQEIFYMQSKELCSKLQKFYIKKTDLVFEADLSVRAINTLKSCDLPKDITIEDLSKNYKPNDLCKHRNMGKKTIDELEELILCSGIEKWK